MLKIAVAFLLLLAINPVSGQLVTKNAQWSLLWEDNFEQSSFDTAVWSKIPRHSPAWAKYMSDDDSCYGMKDGNLVLRGLINPDRASDTATYITGGLYTLGKHDFYRGRVEVRAKLQGAKGAWPAIWLLPADPARNPWPRGGEIDIMERLNFDSIAYQTVHSYYTYELKLGGHPPQGKTAGIRPHDYNVYAVELYSDRVVFFINDIHTFTYPRIETEKEGQFPFDKPFYLLIDMQLGGDWVGRIDPLDLPVEMEVDWVKFYGQSGGGE